jgi:hypothetical protein
MSRHGSSVSLAWKSLSRSQGGRWLCARIKNLMFFGGLEKFGWRPSVRETGANHWPCISSASATPFRLIWARMQFDLCRFLCFHCTICTPPESPYSFNGHNKHQGPGGPSWRRRGGAQDGSVPAPESDPGFTPEFPSSYQRTLLSRETLSPKAASTN